MWLPATLYPRTPTATLLYTPLIMPNCLQWPLTACGAKSRLLWIIARTLPISLVQCRHLLPIKLNLSDIVSMCSHRPMSSHFFTLFLGFLIHKCQITVFILPYHSAAPDTANHFCSPQSLPLASISTLPIFSSHFVNPAIWGYIVCLSIFPVGSYFCEI